MTPSPTIGVLVFEKLPFWGPELKRQFTGQSVMVRECRSVHDLLPAAAEFAESVAVVSLDAAPTDCLAWLGRQFQTASRCRIVVIASAELADLEWPVREAGAVGFVHDEIPGDRLARLCRRLLRTAAASAPRVAALRGR